MFGTQESRRKIVAILVIIFGITALSFFAFLHRSKAPSQDNVAWKFEHNETSTKPNEVTLEGERLTSTTTISMPSTTTKSAPPAEPELQKQISKTTIVSTTTRGKNIPLEPFSVEAMLVAHNTIRKEHKLPLLTWSPILETSAATWSQNLQKRGCVMEHDPNNEDYGENIFWQSVTGDGSSSQISKPEDAVTWWANEKTYYTYTTNTCRGGEQCGHYTQLVWRDTKEVGCGVSTCVNGDTQTDIWVCRYNPPGNFIGEKPY